MFKVIILSLLSFWIHYAWGFEVLPSMPATYWWDVPLLVTLITSWGLSTLWLVHKEMDK